MNFYNDKISNASKIDPKFSFEVMQIVDENQLTDGLGI